jgi:hypothetical protein
MILVEENPTIKKSHEFATNAFSIETSRKAFGILSSNIYTEKILAIVRELSTNALDSHIEAGNDAPFDVHIPTWIEPYFSIRDYGVGMSHETCTQLYTTYFASTKADSNDFTGCMGIGSKAFFCKYNSATITSYYNGVARSYSAYKDDEGIPQFSLLAENETEEPNGVLVKIDCQKEDIDDFEEAAIDVYSFFKRRPNVNLEKINIALKKRDEDIIFDGEHCRIYYCGTSKAIMGNVAYNFNPTRIKTQACRLKQYSLKFDLGEVNFDPGRENLTLDTKTVDALNRKYKLAYDEVMTYIEEESEKETLDFDKKVKYNKLANSILYSAQLKFHKISPYISLIRNNERVKERPETADLATSGYDLFSGDVTTIKKYMRQERIRFAAVVPPDFESNHVKKSEDLVINKVPRVPRGSYQKSPNIKKYEGYWKLTDLDMSQPYIYVETKFDDSHIIGLCLEYLKESGIEIELYGLKPHLKRRGKGVSLQTFLKGKIPEKFVLYIKSNNAHILEQFDSNFKDKNDYQLLKVMRHLGVNIVETRVQSVYEKELFRRRPMMQFVEYRHSPEEIKIIKEYMK